MTESPQRPSPEAARFPTRLLASVAVVALVGAAVSALLAQHHSGTSGIAARFVQAVCGGAASGCDAVNRSAASSFLGLPIALFGFWFYGAIAVLALIAACHRRAFEIREIRVLALAGAGVDAGLLLHSIVGIGAVCSLCIVTYAVTAAIVALAFIALRRARSAAPEAAVAGFSGVALSHVLGLLAVISGGAAVLGAGARAADTPEDALAVAWRAFHSAYLETKESSIDYQGSPRRGSARPVLQMALFADFQCPHCKRLSDRLIRFTEQHRDAAQLVFKHYPLDTACNKLADSIHAGACLLAHGAEAAARQNRFWHFHDALFANQEAWLRGVTREQLTSLAAQSGLDADRFSQDLDAPDVASLVRRDVDEANSSLDVTATPTLFINGRKMKSIPIDEFLDELLLAEATRLRPIGLEQQRAARVRAGQ